MVVNCESFFTWYGTTFRMSLSPHQQIHDAEEDPTLLRVEAAAQAHGDAMSYDKP